MEAFWILYALGGHQAYRVFVLESRGRRVLPRGVIFLFVTIWPLGALYEICAGAYRWLGERV